MVVGVPEQMKRVEHWKDCKALRVSMPNKVVSWPGEPGPVLLTVYPSVFNITWRLCIPALALAYEGMVGRGGREGKFRGAARTEIVDVAIDCSVDGDIGRVVVDCGVVSANCLVMSCEI